MSGQAPQRVRRNASPSSTKQGPMRATVPVSLMRQGSPTQTTAIASRISKKISPSESPTSIWNVDARTKSQNSPDMRNSPERRSPGSPILKEKSKTLNVKSSTLPKIRRTASLDTIYLTGQWPRDLFHTYCGRPLVDKSTQTDEWGEAVDKRPQHHAKQTNPVSSGERLDSHTIRQRLQRSKESSRQTSANGQHHSPVHGDHSAISSASSSALTQPPPYMLPMAHSTHTVSRAINIPNGNIPKPLIPRMRNSVEGLNQEIEKLVLRTPGNEDIEKQIHEPTPDGHRAPIADILRQTRNVDTQTPLGVSVAGGFGDNSPSLSPISYCHSVSPVIPGVLDTSRPSSQNETEVHCHDATPYEKDGDKSASPEPPEVQLGTSPSINKFLAREPPDGCERVKIIDESRKPQQAVFASVAYLRPNPSNSAFKTSSSSAFYSPFKVYHPSVATSDLAVLSLTANPQSSTTSIEG